MQECEAQVVARDEQFVPSCFRIGWKAHCILQWKHGLDEGGFIELDILVGGLHAPLCGY